MTRWLPLTFRLAPALTASGICRLLLTEMDEHVSVYVTPINIDPDRPAMPISHPSYYATYLSKQIGRFATLGLAEDTGALNDEVIGEKQFLQQTADIDREQAFAVTNLGSALLDLEERGVAMSWYLDKHTHKIQADYIELEDKRSDRTLDELRVQLQVIF